MVGWQARFNYIGDRMRVNTVNFMPFTDNNTGQNVCFVNLPIDQLSGLHRTVTGAGGTGPVAPPDGSNTLQTRSPAQSTTVPKTSQSRRTARQGRAG